MKKILVALLILIIVSVGVGLYFAPVYFEQALQRQVKEYLGRELQLGKVSLNPLNFSAQLEQLILLDADGQPQLTVSRVEAHTSFWGFWARTGQINSLTLQEPTLFVEDNESGRLKFIQFLSDLFAAATKLPEKAQIASLILEQASIVMLDRSQTPASVKSYPPFNLATGSFDSARSGTFQFSREIVGQPGLMMDGVLNWKGAGASGQISGADLDPKMFVPWSGVEFNSQGKLSLQSDFSLVLTERALVLDLKQLELAVAAIKMRQQQLLGFSAEAMTVNGDLGLTFDAEGLWLREAVIASNDFTLHGMGIDTSAVIQIPLRDTRLVLGNLDLKADSAVQFDLLMHTEPLGGVQLVGIYDPKKHSNRADFHLVEVPLSSLLAPSRDLFPRALSSEVLSADGSIQLHPSASEIEYEAGLVNQRLVQGLNRAISETGPGQVASLLLAGQFQSGGKVSLLGFSSPGDPLRKSYLGLRLDEIDAALASPITHDLAARSIASGELETELILRLANGRLTGRQDLALENLVLEPSTDPLTTAEPTLEFSVALLQDAQNRIEFSLPVDAVVDDDFQFTRLMRQTATRHLAQVAAEPVDTLAALLGTDRRNLETISFEPGQAGLSVTSMAQMEWIKTALQWRPGLSLSVSETYDPEADRYALAYQQVRLHVLLATAADAEFRSNYAPILFTDPKVQVVLDEFAGSRLGATTVNLIAESFGLSADPAEQPPPADVQEAYYRALFDALVMQEQIGERALFSLARYRARAVIDQLAQEGIERNRLSRGGQQAVKTSLVRGVPVSLYLGYFDEPQALDEQSSEQDAGDPLIESNEP